MPINIANEFLTRWRPVDPLELEARRAWETTSGLDTENIDWASARRILQGWDTAFNLVSEINSEEELVLELNSEQELNSFLGMAPEVSEVRNDK